MESGFGETGVGGERGVGFVSRRSDLYDQGFQIQNSRFKIQNSKFEKLGGLQPFWNLEF